MREASNGLPADVAALTEADGRFPGTPSSGGDVGKRDVAIVIGCGPVRPRVILCPSRPRRSWTASPRLFSPAAARWPPPRLESLLRPCGRVAVRSGVKARGHMNDVARRVRALVSTARSSPAAGRLGGTSGAWSRKLGAMPSTP